MNRQRRIHGGEFALGEIVGRIEAGVPPGREFEDRGLREVLALGVTQEDFRQENADILRGAGVSGDAKVGVLFRRLPITSQMERQN